MEAIATYEQRYGGMRRRFSLYSDRLEIHGRSFASSFDQEISLASVAPQFDRAEGRPPLFYGGIAMLAMAAIGFVVLALDRGLVRVSVAIVALIAAVGVVCIAIRPRPLRVFMFKNAHGEYLFEIVGAGPDVGRLEDFVRLISAERGKFQAT